MDNNENLNPDSADPVGKAAETDFINNTDHKEAESASIEQKESNSAQSQPTEAGVPKRRRRRILAGNISAQAAETNESDQPRRRRRIPVENPSAQTTETTEAGQPRRRRIPAGNPSAQTTETTEAGQPRRRRIPAGNPSAQTTETTETGQPRRRRIPAENTSTQAAETIAAGQQTEAGVQPRRRRRIPVENPSAQTTETTEASQPRRRRIPVENPSAQATEATVTGQPRRRRVKVNTAQGHPARTAAMHKTQAGADSATEDQKKNISVQGNAAQANQEQGTVTQTNQVQANTAQAQSKSVSATENKETSASTETEKNKKPSAAAQDNFEMPSRKASFRKKVEELKQIDYKEKLESIKETGAATKDTLIKTTQEVSKTEAGKKVILETNRAKRFLKSKKGKRFLYAVVVLLIVLAGFGRWRSQADLRNGLALCEDGDYVDAQTPLLNAVARDNKNPKAYNALGMAYLGSGDYTDAIKQFKLAQNMDKENQDTYRGLGIAYYNTGEYEKAVSAFDKALELCRLNVNNTEYDIMWYRGECELALENYEDAVYTYSALMELEGDSAILRYYRGNVYCEMGEKEKAMEDFDAAIAMPGNGYELFFNIYNSMEKAGWSEEADNYLKKTTETGYIDASTIQNQAQKSKNEGIVCYLQGSYAEALNLFASNGLANDFDAQKYSALSYEGLGETKKAQSIYKQLVKDNPYNAESYNAMALYLMRMGKYKKAITYLNQGIENCPAADQEVLYYNIVTAYESMGDMEAAKDALRQYGVIYGQSNITHEKAFVKERDRS